ncbi:MAG: pentapeptide repeat-containing protein [Bacteroidia bacterium]|nr:pentapeptide repeat-containing protein [Bacteroidia bacterium]HQV01737.1 pentapeptide repeat-containing protein [Bacteroidia bacterium]
MQNLFIQDTTIKNETALQKGEYENCTFINCNFESNDISNFIFIDCTFNSCNLSLAKLNNTAFRVVKFIDCKMLGLKFETCNDFGLSFSFDACQLNHSSFYKTKIKRAIFKNTILQEVDFTECDLTEGFFDNCNMLHAVFDETILNKVNFTTAYNYIIDPDINQIKKAKFSQSGIVGLLNKYDIVITD